MTAPLSQDLRKRLVHAVEEGASAREAAARFAVSASAAIRLVRRLRETGSTVPVRIGGYRKPLLAGQEKFPQGLTASRKGITLAEIRAALIERGVVPVSLMTIWSMLRRIDQTHKTYAPPRPQAVLGSDQSTPTYPVTRQSHLGQDGDPRVLVLTKATASERHFLCQVSRTPVDCQAISLPPPADFIQPPAPGKRERLILPATTPSSPSSRTSARCAAPRR